MAKNVTLTLTSTQAQALMALLGGVADKAPTTKSSKSVSAKKSSTTSKKFAFTKKDGTIAYAKSQKQLDAWKAYAERAEKRERKTVEELQAITDAFKWTAKLDKAIKANPSISTKEIHELGGKGCTKQMLKARKVELKVR